MALANVHSAPVERQRRPKDEGRSHRIGLDIASEMMEVACGPAKPRLRKAFGECLGELMGSDRGRP